MKKHISLIITILMLSLIIAGCTNHQSTMKNEEIKTVKIITAKKTSLQLTTEYPGILTPYKQVMVAAKMPGKVSKVNVNVGDKVNAGDILFTLDTKDIDAQLSQAQAAVDVSKANLYRTKNSLFAQQISQAEYAQKEAQLQYDEAKNAYDNLITLYKKGLASEKDVNEAKAKVDNAKLQLDSATDNLNILNKKVIPDAVDAANAQVEQAQAAENAILVQKEGTVITSPLSGIVEAKNVEVGQMISNSTPAYIIDDLTKLYAVTNVPDTIAASLKKGQKISVRLDSNHGEIAGWIDNISPNADLRSHLFTIKIAIDNKNNAYKPGLFVKIPFISEKAIDCVVVPNSAIIVENGVQFAYIVKDNKVKKVIVNTGISDGKNTQIISGVKEGDMVVCESQSFLTDGERVSIKR